MSSREEFEAWYRKDVCSWSNLSIDSDGEYFGQMARTAWRAWQASRQALVIDLDDVDYSNGGLLDQGDVIRAIEAAGVRLKA